MALKLILGNKNYSSWSLRPWIAMRHAGIAFTEEVIPLYEPGSAERMAAYAPTGKVPVLIDGDMVIWESLAILDHLAELFPHAGLWPRDAKARAHARAISAEMHAGFVPLRKQCPMNMHRESRPIELTPETQANVARIDAMWSECRSRFGGQRPFLFGDFCAADAMYAPVVSRFHTYAIAISPVAAKYMEAVMALPAYREWQDAALQETWVMPGNEVA